MNRTLLTLFWVYFVPYIQPTLKCENPLKKSLYFDYNYVFIADYMRVSSQYHKMNKTNCKPCKFHNNLRAACHQIKRNNIIQNFAYLCSHGLSTKVARFKILIALQKLIRNLPCMHLSPHSGIHKRSLVNDPHI